MSSYSGEIGLIYRTAYCSSKFAVTGFFEALRMETAGSIFITIICPPTVETNLRKNALVFKTSDKESTQNNNSKNDEKLLEDGLPPPKKYSMKIPVAIDYVIMAIDTKMRKVLFPHKAWYTNLIRPVVPDMVDRRLLEVARL